MASNKKPTGLRKIGYHYSRAWRKPTVKVVHLLIFAAVFMWLGHFLFPSHALTYPYENTTAAGNDFSRINNYRSGKGWRLYNRAGCLNTIASHWAKKEAAANAISEPDATWMKNQLASYCSGKYWLAWGANDGQGPNDGDVFTSFLNSCEHLQNIADHGTGSTTVKTPAGKYCTFKSVAFNSAGTGAWEGSSGYLFVSQVFARW